MDASRAGRLFRRVDRAEEQLCRRINRACRRPAVRDVFRLVSRLGDGVVWYTLILLLPVLVGARAIAPAVQMTIVALVGVALYKALKSQLVRERPYVSHVGIVAGALPLDRYSFPSGHTLHAVSLTILATAHYPVLGWLLVPFATAVAASRVILGLHYPSDVLAGAGLGAALAATALAVPLPPL